MELHPVCRRRDEISGVTLEGLQRRSLPPGFGAYNRDALRRRRSLQYHDGHEGTLAASRQDPPRSWTLLLTSDSLATAVKSQGGQPGRQGRECSHIFHGGLEYRWRSLYRHRCVA